MSTDPLEWVTLDRRVSYTCPGFDVITESVRLPNGTETTYDYLSEPPSVCIIPFTPDDELVCIEEWRQAVSRVNRGFPAGGVEPDDDDLAAAARRELTEETGYVADSIDPLVSVEPANGIADSTLHFFVARGCLPTGDRNLDVDESIRVKLISLDEFRTAVETGGIRDGRAVLGLSYYLLLES